MQTMKVSRTDEGRYVVPLSEVAEAIGYSGHVHVLDEMAKKTKTKLRITEEPDGTRVLDADQAASFIESVRAFIDAEHEKHEAYRAYLAQQKRIAAERRDAEALEQRRQARLEAEARNEAWTIERARKAEAEIAMKAARKAAREGNPMSAEEFFKKRGF